ncbi:lanthionine synthetase LanC family protein [Actinocatenispora rupis]|uniref:Lanthionine synthetase C-like protein n=1 Tax=Actinocatenispora rupis TaxID=519421 RepID=A0A8J3J802_9ACTN|nr:lanthionine synthetase LanC family protein [Actinocatenispora rupis]GID15713.1 hypothetical protein Aru02nite_66020 [Actinocatenispora rupis]
MGEAAEYRETGEAAWSWVLAQVRGDDGPWLPETVPVDGDAPSAPSADRDGLYGGLAGLAPLLAEIARYRPLTDAERALADAIVARLAATAPERTEPSWADGLAGHVAALRLLEPGREQVALRRLADLRTPEGWPTTFEVDATGPLTDMIMGTAGVVLAAAWAGGPYAAGLMTTGGEALLRVAEETDAGLDWRMWPGYPASTPNFAHGTAGVSAALAVAGTALGRDDFVTAAVRGTRHLLAVGSLADDAFVVPHTLPYSTRDVEPVTYGWCHGPTGLTYLCTALARAGVTAVDGHPVAELRTRCVRAVLDSGLPRRLRPGFWDNDGRCCGTAGVGDMLLDTAQDTGSADLLVAARTMGDALLDRAVRDEAGARWRFVEHRIDEPLLPPGTSWMQGAAGIAAFLFRLSRVLDDGETATVVDRPEQWWAVPDALRLTRTR